MSQRDLLELEARPTVRELHVGGQARRTLAQLRSDGLSLEVLEADVTGPTLIRRHSMVDSTWRRVHGTGGGAVYEEVAREQLLPS